MATAKLSLLDAMLAKSPPKWEGSCALFGDDDYLRHLARLFVLHQFGLSQTSDAESFVGREARWRDIADALSARSLFDDGPSVVLIEQADTFVTAHRPQLEDWASQPRRESLLILEVKTWPGNTRLAKAAAKLGPAIECSVPAKGAELGKFKRNTKTWLTRRAKDVHQVTVDSGAIDTLMDLLPLSLGVLDQELARLALLAEDGKITHAVVTDHVGGWRTRQTWDMIDAAAEGNTSEALRQLDRLIAAGEDPIALLAQVASTFRRYATAAMTVEHGQRSGRRVPLSAALQRAGVLPFKVAAAEQQMKQIGRSRALRLSEWLLDADLAMKGRNSQKEAARRELECLVIRLGPQADARRHPSAMQR